MKVCRRAGALVFYVNTEFRLYTGNGGEEAGCQNVFPPGENRGYDFVQSDRVGKASYPEGAHKVSLDSQVQHDRYSIRNLTDNVNFNNFLLGEVGSGRAKRHK